MQEMVAAPVGTTATTATGADANKVFSLNLLSITYAGVGALKEKNSKSPFESLNSVGLMYKASDLMTYELRGNFSYKGNQANEDGSTFNAFKNDDPTVHAYWSTGKTLLGSNPITIESRYYIPTSQESKDARSTGVWRTQSYINYVFNPRLSMDYFVQTRFYFFNGSPTVGSDSSLRFITGPTLYYNFNDQFNAYYFPSIDTRSRSYSHGNLGADEQNNFVQEVGFNYKIGPVAINPCWITTASALGKSSYEGAGSDATSEYDLVVSATF